MTSKMENAKKIIKAGKALEAKDVQVTELKPSAILDGILSGSAETYLANKVEVAPTVKVEPVSPKTRLPRWRWLAIAASLVILFATGLVFGLLLGERGTAKNELEPKLLVTKIDTCTFDMNPDPQCVDGSFASPPVASPPVASPPVASPLALSPPSVKSSPLPPPSPTASPPPSPTASPPPSPTASPPPSPTISPPPSPTPDVSSPPSPTPAPAANQGPRDAANTTSYPEAVPSPPSPPSPPPPPPSTSPSPLPTPPPSPSPPLPPVAPPPVPICVTVDNEDLAFETNAQLAVPGHKPYFDTWHGETSSKSFVHDDTGSKGALHGTFRPALPETGCYAVQEWHPTGGFYCLKYMPVAVPLTVHHANGSSLVHVDQSEAGAQWNTVGQFHFGAGAAQLVLENNGTTDCEYGYASYGGLQQKCYWTADAVRVVRVGDTCGAAPPAAAVLDAKCLAAAAAAPPSPAMPPSALLSTFSHLDGRSLSVALTPRHHVSEGPVSISYSATGFPASSTLAVLLVHGTEWIYQIGGCGASVDADTDAGAVLAAYTLPNLHVLVEHCSSCTPGSGGWQIAIVQVPADLTLALALPCPCPCPCPCPHPPLSLPVPSCRCSRRPPRVPSRTPRSSTSTGPELSRRRAVCAAVQRHPLHANPWSGNGFVERVCTYV